MTIFIKILVLTGLAGFSLAAVAESQIERFSSQQLQQAVDARLNQNPLWKSLLRKKKMAVCVLDLSQKPARLASVNGDHMMYAASLPKIAILLAAHQSFEDGSLPDTPEIREDLQAMIRVSSNAAATRMIDRVGMAKIAAVLQDPKYGFYDKDNGGGLWVGKRFASAGARRGDPLFNISHGATANQVCRFFYLLQTRQLINEKRSEQMLDALSNPKLHHKFVSQIDQLAPQAKVYRKSGSWKKWHADAVLVEGIRWRNYILVGLVEHQSGEAIIRRLLPAMEELIKPKASDNQQSTRSP